jgi:hypothetical protein
MAKTWKIPASLGVVALALALTSGASRAADYYAGGGGYEAYTYGETGYPIYGYGGYIGPYYPNGCFGEPYDCGPIRVHRHVTRHVVRTSVKP